jgi:hypothetical protein
MEFLEKQFRNLSESISQRCLLVKFYHNHVKQRLDNVVLEWVLSPRRGALVIVLTRPPLMVSDIPSTNLAVREMQILNH